MGAKENKEVTNFSTRIYANHLKKQTRLRQLILTHYSSQQLKNLSNGTGAKENKQKKGNINRIFIS